MWIAQLGFMGAVGMAESGLGGKVVCGACCRPIIDRYLMRIADMSYHERCLLCSVCHAPLSHTCFIRDSKLFCRHDYERLYVKRCLGCSERIGPEELVMRAVESVFHLRCFLCVVCGVRLQKGDQFVVKQGQLFCRPDYEKEVEMFQGYAQGNHQNSPESATHLRLYSNHDANFSEGEYGCEELGAAPRSQDGRRGPKRPRTILTSQQRRAFKASFEISPKPCRKVREGLAKDTGLSVRIVQVWFQNQRAKMKKMQKKAKNNNNKDVDSMDEKPDKLKEEDHSSQGGGGFLNDSCSDNEGAGGVGVGPGALHIPEAFQRDYLPVKEESESEETAFYKNMLADQHAHPTRQFINPDGGVKTELVGGGGGGMFVGYGGGYGSSGGGGPPLFLDQPPPPPLPAHHVNPIDRLYSMQNSYFCAEDNALMGQ